MSRSPRPMRVWLLIAASAVGAAGCALDRSPVSYARAFPDMTQSETLDIQVLRRAGEIELTNTSARSFGASTLWLNQRYARPIEEFKPGQTLRLSLMEFRDEYSEPFRPGGFFSVEAAEKVVLTQLETAQGEEHTLIGLVTLGREAD